jgi:hypothetical protein
VALAPGAFRDLLFLPLKPAAGRARPDRRWAAIGRRSASVVPDPGACARQRRELWLGRDGGGGAACPLAGDPIGCEPALSSVFDKLDRASAPGEAIFGRRHLNIATHKAASERTPGAVG